MKTKIGLLAILLAVFMLSSCAGHQRGSLVAGQNRGVWRPGHNSPTNVPGKLQDPQMQRFLETRGIQEEISEPKEAVPEARSEEEQQEAPAAETEAEKATSGEAFSAPIFEETPDIRPLDRIGRLEDVIRAQGFMTVRVVFAPAGSELDETAKELLSREVRGKVLAIIGNASLGGDRQQNIDLSLARASAVADFLALQGRDLAGVKLIGKGPSNRYGSGDTENRRATIVFQK